MKQEEAQQEFQEVEDRFLDVVYQRYLDGKLSEKDFIRFLDECGLEAKFLEKYMKIDTLITL